MLRSRSGRTWLLLVLATLAAFELSCHAEFGRYAGLSALLMAYIKGRLVVLDFMELRHAPIIWRVMTEAWLPVISLLIAAVYLWGRLANPGI